MLPQDFLGIDLQRVLIAPKQPADQVVHVLTVELYADGLILQWVVPDKSGSEALHRFRGERRFGMPDIDVADDVGTDYQEGTCIGGGGGRWRGSHSWVPAVPAAATTLTVTIESEWSIRLSL